MGQVYYGSYVGNDNNPLSNTRTTITPPITFTIGYLLTYSYPGAVITIRSCWRALSDAMGVNGGAVTWQGNNYSTANAGIKLNDSTFIVGYDTNKSGVTYNYMLVENDATCYAQGTYTGTGAAKVVNTGQAWTPDVVMIAWNRVGAAAGYGIWNAAKGGNATVRIAAESLGWVTNLVTAVGAGTFSLGTSFVVNQLNSGYSWMAWKDKTDVVTHGMYTGNGADNRNIVASSMVVNGIMLTPVGPIGGVTRYTSTKMTQITGDLTVDNINTSLQANMIQQINPDKSPDFQVGSDAGTNFNGATTTYPWIAWGPGESVAIPMTLPPSMPGVGGPGALIQTPYTHYKNVRQAVQTYNDLTIGP